MRSPQIHTGQEAIPHDGASDIVKVLLAIFLPPVGVLFEVGITKHFFLNILLTILGYIPGIVHAVWIIARK